MTQILAVVRRIAIVRRIVVVKMMSQSKLLFMFASPVDSGPLMILVSNFTSGEAGSVSNP
jgi:siroheme synthase (precorrin-2 oxidase/ferrochelatase)